MLVWMRRSLGTVGLLLISGLLVSSLSNTAAAQLAPIASTLEGGRQSPQYEMTGTIELRDSRFVLLDGTGQLEAYLVPRQSIDLNRYRGKTVKATVREPLMRMGTEPRLWVEKVDPINTPAPVLRSIFDTTAPGRVAPAQYSEPIVTDTCQPMMVTDVVVSMLVDLLRGFGPVPTICFG